MWTVSHAPPEPPPPRRAAALRIARLALHVLRMWCGALLLTPRLDAERRRRQAQRWSRQLLRALRVEVYTLGRLPRAGAPVLYVSNHVSWLDSYAMSTVDPARFVAKSEVAGWPVIGTIAARVGTIFIKRYCVRSAARTVGALAQALCGGHAVAAFPESTTTDGRALLPFYPALFQSAVLTGTPVQPVALRYRDHRGAPTTAAAYVGEMSVLDSLRLLLREPRLRVELVFLPPIDPAGRTRRELAALARTAIAGALGVADDSRRPEQPGPAALRRAA